MRVPERRRLGQGPDRRPDDRRGREGRPDPPGRHPHRTDQREHRHRPRPGGGDQGLSDDHHDAREDESREAGDSRGTRCRDHPHAHRGGLGRSREPHRRGQAPARGDSAGPHLGPVRQREQSARPLSRHRGRDRSPVGRQTRRVRGDGGNRRDPDGHRSAPQGRHSELQDRRRRSRGIDPRRPRRDQELQGRGHRLRLHSRRPRSWSRRRVDQEQRRRFVPDLAETDQGRKGCSSVVRRDRRCGRLCRWLAI